MHCLHQPMNPGTLRTPRETDCQKITRIRKKIEEVFGSASTWDDPTISERYDLSSDGDLVMILR